VLSSAGYGVRPMLRLLRNPRTGVFPDLKVTDYWDVNQAQVGPAQRIRRSRIVAAMARPAAQRPAAGTKLPNAGGVSVVISRGPRRNHAGT
jgi:hypothetical protein